MFTIFKTQTESASAVAAEPVNCGCGCGDWGDEYAKGMKAGVDAYYNPTKALAR